VVALVRGEDIAPVADDMAADILIGIRSAWMLGTDARPRTVKILV
jgi:hypothetical protein